MLERTVNHATDAVSHDVAQLRSVVLTRPGETEVLVFVQAAARELCRTYLALMAEASRISRFGPDELHTLAALQRSRLVTRVHQSVGRFSLIEAVSETVLARVPQDEALNDVEEVLRSWSDRETHLFSILVPLAAVADELCTDVRGIVTLPSRMAQAIESRSQLARRAVDHAYRQLAKLTRLLQEFADELRQLTGVAAPELEFPASAQLSNREVVRG